VAQLSLKAAGGLSGRKVMVDGREGNWFDLRKELAVWLSEWDILRWTCSSRYWLGNKVRQMELDRRTKRRKAG
jgi:hypothetical protein